MASSPTLAGAGAALFLLLALFSTAVHGRESHFFSRVAANTNPTPTPATTTTTVSVPAVNANTVDANAVNNGQQYQQPSFVQESDNNGYGIYGHQTPEETTSFDQTAATTKLTSSPTSNFRPYNAQTNSDETFRNNDEKYYNNDRYYGQSGYNADNNNDEFEDEQREQFGETSMKQQENNGYKKTVANSRNEFGNSGYENNPVAKGYNYNNNNNGNQQGQFGETSLQQQDNNGYKTTAANSRGEFSNGGYENSPVAKGYNYNGKQQGQFGETSLQQQDNTGYETTAANSDRGVRNGFETGAVAKGYNYNNNGNGDERQGMSDTRYLEGGKYYVDINNQNQYQQGISSSSSSSSDFTYNDNVKNQNGYYSNGNNGDQNSYEFANPMNNRNQLQQQQQPEYFQGNNYQNQQYVP